MGRYREPQKPGSRYVTPEGYRALQDELSDLWKRRAGVTQALGEAAAEGDRSENAEYIYRKKQLREMDRRIRYLQKRLDELQVVAHQPDADRIFFGAWVTLEAHQGGQVTYRIVGPDEFDVSKGYISVDAPVAQGLLNKCLGDEVVVQRPDGEIRFVVLAISYTGPPG
ncbi:MAG: transcription elongation factor GreB [Gammaproteobacteria bacterium]|nr:MAG: transcription elongation factor GreB [Gammaproteobacteria bacterium]